MGGFIFGGLRYIYLHVMKTKCYKSWLFSFVRDFFRAGLFSKSVFPRIVRPMKLKPTENDFYGLKKLF